MKKFLVLTLAASMTLGLFSACGGSSTTASTNPGNSTPAAAVTEGEASAPESEAPAEGEASAPESETPAEGEATAPAEGVTLRIFRPDTAEQPAQDDLMAFQMLQDNTGINIDWESAPVDTVEERFNLIMAGGDIPDVVIYYVQNLMPDANSGAFLPINDLLESHGQNILREWDEDPTTKKTLTYDDGSIYMIPNLAAMRGAQVHFTRMDWLEEYYGGKFPTTTDEYYEMLKAFKDNGVELPFVTKSKSPGLDPIVEMFGIKREFFLDNGEVTYGMTDPRMKDALTYLNKLYAEGLIDPEYLTSDADNWLAKVTTGRGAVSHDWAGRMDVFSLFFETNDPSVTFKGFAPPAAPGVEPGTFYQMDRIRNTAAVFSKDTPFATEAMIFFDYMFSPEGNIILNFGKEGDTYTMVDGVPTYTEKIFTDPEGRTPQNTLRLYGMGHDIPYETHIQNEMQMVTDNANEIRDLYQEKYLRQSLPLLAFTPEERSTYSSVYTEIQTYAEEAFDAFVMGSTPLTEWDAFVEQLNGMGAQDILQIQKDAYARFQAR